MTGSAQPVPPVALRSSTGGRLMVGLGGRFSIELGIDVDRDPGEVERWFLAATLFGTRISARVAMQTYRVLSRAGISTIADVAGATWDRLVELLDEGGYVRYDFRTATRLQQLEAAVRERYGGISVLGSTVTDPVRLEAALDALPGWGPVTTRVFLRELRAVWPGARPAVDDRALWSAAHLGLRSDESAEGALAWLEATALGARVDCRDFEAALVRLALAHRARRSACLGGADCVALGTAGRAASSTPGWRYGNGGRVPRR